MVQYIKEEIISSSVVSRQFGSILDKIQSHELEKVAVIRNNKMEAVIISLEEYEALNNMQELLEDMEIYNSVKDRLNTPKSEFVNFEDVLSKLGMNVNEI